MTQVRISDAIREVALEPSRELDDVPDAYYAPDYVHRGDGRTLTVPASQKCWPAYAAGS
jgi:hypothetical protein